MLFLIIFAIIVSQESSFNVSKLLENLRQLVFCFCRNNIAKWLTRWHCPGIRLSLEVAPSSLYRTKGLATDCNADKTTKADFASIWVDILFWRSEHSLLQMELNLDNYDTDEEETSSIYFAKQTFS